MSGGLAPRITSLFESIARFDAVGADDPAAAATADDAGAAGDVPTHASVLGRSREAREIHGYRFGDGPVRVSLIAGCHADEPVGPRLLRALVAGLAHSRASPDLGRVSGLHELFAQLELWIIPHINPDGERRNRAWQTAGAAAYRLSSYLAGTVRELPGDDIEFGFPRGPDDDEARPETRAAVRWWATADGPFDLHVTLHGMATAAGPWFLVEPAWVDRAGPLMERCAAAAADLGYVLHDVERGGEKGFHRIRRGFTTRPASGAMRDHFLALGDPETASRFRPSSMEHMRSLGGDPLTLVSEMPLFLLPGVGEELGPPDPAAEEWKRRLDEWRARLAGGAEPGLIDGEAAEAGLRAMPVRDQMRLQWTMIAAAVELVASEGTSSLARPG